MDVYLHVSSRRDTGLLAETTRMQSPSQPFMGSDSVLFRVSCEFQEGTWSVNARNTDPVRIVAPTSLQWFFSIFL